MTIHFVTFSMMPRSSWKKERLALRYNQGSSERLIEKDEEGTTPSDAVDLICDAEWQADQHHDDQGEPYRQSIPYEGKAPDGSKPGTDCKVQTPVRAGIGGEQRQQVGRCLRGGYRFSLALSRFVDCVRF